MYLLRFLLTVSLACVLSHSSIFAGDQEAYPVPKPEGEEQIIWEFSKAIEGTDGTPESIGKKIEEENPEIRAAVDAPVVFPPEGAPVSF